VPRRLNGWLLARRCLVTLGLRRLGRLLPGLRWGVRPRRWDRMRRLDLLARHLLPGLRWGF